MRTRGFRRVSIVVAAICLAGCGAMRERDMPDRPERSIDDVLARHSDSLMARPGVVGTAIGLCGDVPCIHIMVSDSSETIRDGLPDRLEGYEVLVRVTGPFRPRGRRD